MVTLIVPDTVDMPLADEDGETDQIDADPDREDTREDDASADGEGNVL